MNFPRDRQKTFLRSLLSGHRLYFLTFLFLFLSGPVLSAREDTYRYIIRNAYVFDGKSPEGFLGDVAISEDKIAAVGNLKDAKALEEIEGKDLVLAPGFIDVHTHSDFNPLVYPELPNKLMQGVTTEIIGNCGMSAAPVLGPFYQEVKSVWAREGVMIPQPISWRTYGEYRRTIEAAGLLTNFVGFVGHGNLRAAVLGFSAREATQSEIQEMKKLLDEAMKDGAYGISFGLVYIPGVYADGKEVTELCREAAKNAGLCSFHMRSEGNQLIEAIQEVITVAARAQAKVQISHLKASGKRNWEKIDEAFQLIEDAKRRGIQIASDAYPYHAGSAELGVILPSNLYQRPDRDEYFKNIFNREEILRVLRVYDEKNYFSWDSVVLASARDEAYWPYEGLSLKDIARRTHKEPEKFLMDILIDNDFQVNAFYFSQSKDVVERVLQKPYVMIGSDSIADGSRRPHPRAYGTFPKIFKDYVRSKKLLLMGEAIRKMTSFPAEYFGLSGRGMIREGYYADLVLLNADRIQDKATYERPDQMSEGIEWVFVNGMPVVRKGIATELKKGRFLKQEWF
ncbi:MAG: D-aminoacylase [Candidatus Omnitrophica bacterium]|nr:D-aminoacylase [Candidatus Omnitrophota bacterium]